MSKSLNPEKQDLKILNCIRRAKEGKATGTPCGYPSSIRDIDLSKTCVKKCVNEIMGVSKQKSSNFMNNLDKKREESLHRGHMRLQHLQKMNKGPHFQSPIQNNMSTSSSDNETYLTPYNSDNSTSAGGTKRQRRKITKRQRQGRKTTKRQTQRRKTTKRQTQRRKTTKRQRQGRKTTKHY
jgi:hypothetical protein